MRIGIDIDNVISNFNEVLLKEYKKHDKEKKGQGIVHKNEYIRNMFHWNKKEEELFYKNHVESFATSLEPLKDSVKYIHKLREDGNEIYIITGRENGEYHDAYSMTVSWLKKYDISYDKLYFVNGYDIQSKTKICLENKVDFMIDDSIRICHNIEENGIKTYLMDTPYNRDDYELERVFSWQELYDLLSNLKKKNVILDTDAFNECDDQFALSYLLKSQDKFQIDAITVAPFSYKTRNVSVKKGQNLSYNEILKICNWCDFDTKDKVFKGSVDYLQNGYHEKNDAVNKIIQFALKNNKTYILAIGALTNVALAIKKNPEIVHKIEIIWLGGNEVGWNDNLESNFNRDIEAVKMIFASNVTLTVLPCKNVVTELKIDIISLQENIGNASELCNYLIQRFYNDGYHGNQESKVIWDIAVIAYMLNKNWFITYDVSCPDINEDTSYEETKNMHNITFVTKINREKIYEDLFKKLGG